MEFLIITSTEDKASMNIRDNFLNSKLYRFKMMDFKWFNNSIFKFDKISKENKKNLIIKENHIYLGLIEQPLIFLDNLELDKSQMNPDLIIIASRHASKTARPAFLVHTTGNWGYDAEFGGNPQELSQTSALLHKAGFLSLIEQSNLRNLKDFSLDIEVTHHGPTSLGKPLIFIELGSSKEEWNIYEAGELVANAIVDTIFKYLNFKQQNDQYICLGFGGTHYAPNFNRLIKNKKVAMSFICPKYYIQELNRKLIKMMIQNTFEKVDFFVIDWKGTNSEDKKHLIPLLEEFDILIKKIKEL